MSKQQEIALVKDDPAAENAKEEAFPDVSELMRQLEAPLIRYAARITRDPEQAKDIVQEAFIKYVRVANDSGSEKIKNISGWMYRITRNRCLDHLKSKRVRVEKPADDKIELFAGSDAPDKELERQEAALMVRRKIMALGERERDIVILKLEHGKSYKEIAEIMDLSVTNVGFLLHTAMKRLMKDLKGSGK